MNSRIAGRPRPLQRRSMSPLLLLALAAVLLTTLVNARSPHPPPLRRLHEPASSSLEILPRFNRAGSTLRPRSFYSTPPHASTLRHSDSLLLSITLPSLIQHDAYLLLRPTENLLHPNAKMVFENGQEEPLRAEDWLLYTGEVISPKWKERIMWEEKSGLRNEKTDERAVIGAARIMVHHPGGSSPDDLPIYEGHFTINNIHYNVVTKENYQYVKTDQDVSADQAGDVIVFRKADGWHDEGAEHGAHSCSHDGLPQNNLSHPIFTDRLGLDDVSTGMFSKFLKRQDFGGGNTPSTNYASSIGSTAGCPSEQQVVYMGVALDCNYIQTYNGVENARRRVLSNWNQITALYRSTFSISLGVTEIFVRSNETCSSSATQGAEWDVSCDAGLTLDQRLSLFSQWRGSRSDDGIGIWHLMSACATDSEVGVAWLATLCQTTSNFQSGSFVSGTGVSTALRNEWALIAHEVGHNFGAIHDCTTGCSLQQQCCPATASSCDAGGRYIMNPTTSESEEIFSPCTIGNVCSNIGSRMVSSSCIQNPGARNVISAEQCGNGIVEGDEQCDPGQSGDTTCCDPQTCRFREGAVCDPSTSGCCTDTCQFSSAGTVCRPAIDDACDFAETCPGNNATCPPDRSAEDGTSCGSNNLACASGRCTSLDRQCQMSGGSMNLTESCGQRNDRSCVVSCRDPRITNQCVVLQTPLVDGSPCGYGGHCYNQTCESGSWQSTAAGWYTSNLQISIPVTVVVGLIVLVILFFLIRCIFRSCSGGGRKSKKNNLAALPPPPMRRSQHGQVPVSQRHSDSVNSQDPITSTGIYPNARSGSPPRDYGNSYYQGGQQQQPGLQPGYNPYGNNQYGHNGNNGQYPGQPAPNGWVDESLYNGQNYGRNEVYGR